jgi:hypothetical protein
MCYKFCSLIFPLIAHQAQREASASTDTHWVAWIYRQWQWKMLMYQSIQTLESHLAIGYKRNGQNSLPVAWPAVVNHPNLLKRLPTNLYDFACHLPKDWVLRSPSRKHSLKVYMYRTSGAQGWQWNWTLIEDVSIPATMLKGTFPWDSFPSHQ